MPKPEQKWVVGQVQFETKASAELYATRKNEEEQIVDEIRSAIADIICSDEDAREAAQTVYNSFVVSRR